MKDDKYIIEARRIIDLLKNDFVLDDGSLCLNINGDYKSHYHIFPDLGDVLPFFIYFGEVKFIEKQIEVFKSILINGILISEFPTFKIKGLAKSYEYSDLLLGLIDYYNFKQDDESKKLLIENVSKSIDIFKFNNTFSSYYWPKFDFNFPIRDSRDGMMIELFVDIYYLFDDEKYLEISKNIYTKLINSSFYKKNNIFPTFSGNKLFNLFSDKFKEGDIMKSNTNTLFAMFSLWKVTEDSKVLEDIINTIESIQHKATVDKGGVITSYNPNSGIKKVSLTPSFAMLDFLCDFYYYHRRYKDIEYAQDIADYWLSRQAKNGLFPLYNDSRETFVDAETDMSIALYKLYELTGEEKYNISANNCLDGMIKVHGKYDYVLSVDIDTEKVLNASKKSKFLALFLKLLILKSELNNGGDIYNNKELFNLLKDR